MKRKIISQFNWFLLTILVLWFTGSLPISGQSFTKITDPNNPIVTTNIDPNYSGAAWIDYDNDGDMDLYTTKRFLFKNDGNGNFTLVSTQIGLHMRQQIGNGASWGDYDNDGDPDVAVAGNSTLIYRNDSADLFSTIDEAPLSINADNRGWACSWGDYNNDGFLDLIITHPAGFLGSPSLPCFLLKNNGDGRFTNIKGYYFTDHVAPYTVATWYDFDQDGDIDLFIASGPANGTGHRDYLFRNMLEQNDTVNFIRIDDLAIGTDLQDGQVWNFIDYDNDGDYDAFITNYGGANDHFYRNDNGTYINISNAMTVPGQHLANSWADVDNDGDLDVVVTGEGGTTFYRNDSGTFTNITTGFTLSGSPRGAVFGDFDNDGDMDLFVSGSGDARGLYRNDNNNGNDWIEISCKGTISNTSAIGTRIKVKSVINGNPVWQLRDISGQNSFNSQNSLRVHFGLGNAVTVDSLVILWPSGQSAVFTNLATNLIYNFTETIPSGFLRCNFAADKISGTDTLTVHFTDLSVTDTSMPVMNWMWDFNNDGTIDAVEKNPVWTYTMPGTYSVKLTVSNGTNTQNTVRQSYITIHSSTEIESGHQNSPDKFELFQNYPNPFNPSTTIKYSVGSGQNISIKIYDVLGKEISQLVNEYKSSGKYSVEFNASKLPGGIYFCRYTAGGFNAVKKIVYLK